MMDEIPARPYDEETPQFVRLAMMRKHLSDAQRRFLESLAQYAVFTGGAAVGKTYVGALRAATIATIYPESKGLVISPLYHSMYAGFGPAHEVRRMVPDGSKIFPSENIIRLPNAAEMRFVHSATDIRGYRADWIWLDEVQPDMALISSMHSAYRIRTLPLVWVTARRVQQASLPDNAALFTVWPYESDQYLETEHR